MTFVITPSSSLNNFCNTFWLTFKLQTGDVSENKIQPGFEYPAVCVLTWKSLPDISSLERTELEGLLVIDKTESEASPIARAALLLLQWLRATTGENVNTVHQQNKERKLRKSEAWDGLQNIRLMRFKHRKFQAQTREATAMFSVPVTSCLITCSPESSDY